jgi:hypothetical protein
LSLEGVPIYASFFFVDIVGLSKQSIPTADQIQKIKVLNKCISECSAYDSVPDSSKIVLPTGDGMAIGYLQYPSLPLKLAIELTEKLRLHNRGKQDEERIEIRVGLHHGPVFIVKDIRGNSNVWGQGIIIARRVMDFGKSGHILLSEKIAKDLRELSAEYKRIIKPLEVFYTKHDEEIMIYSAYDKNFGNPIPPTFAKPSASFQYLVLEVKATILQLDPCIVKYHRFYEMVNVSNEPVAAVSHEIVTDAPTSFDSLNLEIHDTHRRPLVITDVEENEPFVKKFSTAFPKPLKPNQKSTYYFDYVAPEPYKSFENAFFENCSFFKLSLQYPKSYSLHPRFYEKDIEGEKKVRSKARATVRSKGEMITRSWSKSNVLRGESYQLEW